MKTLAYAWVIVLGIYFVTPYAIGDETATSQQTLWRGSSVSGDVCINARTYDGVDGSAEVWIYSDNSVKGPQTIKGMVCIDVPFSRSSALEVKPLEDNTVVEMVKDFTSPYFVVELPM